MARNKKKKRGHLIALLIGFDEKVIHIWKIFSHSVRKHKEINLKRKWKYSDEKQQYHYFQDLIDEIRPFINQTKSIILVSPLKTDYSTSFLEHVNKHHRWLIQSRRNNQVNFGEIEGLATNFKQVNYLITKKEFKELVEEVTSNEADLIIKHLEKAINVDHENAILLYDLTDIEDFIYKGGKKDTTAGEKADFLLLTENFLSNHKQKGRIHRLIQISKNKGLITKIISGENDASSRIDQFGGIICFKKA